MDGSLAPVDCTIYDVLDVLPPNLRGQPAAQPVLTLRERIWPASRRVASPVQPGRAARAATWRITTT